MLNPIFDKLRDIGIIPVVEISQAEKAVPLAAALMKGGIPTAEITFRTPVAIDAIAAVACEFPGFLVGAGTVSTVEQAESAVSAGAGYIVSPGLNFSVVTWCQQREIPVIPGVATPTEIEAAMQLGLTVLKFFPAEQNGGAIMLKALEAPYRNIKFIPTGGIGPKNLNDYLSLPNVIACGGSWMAPCKTIDAGNFKSIMEICMESIRLMHGFKLLHVGLNSKDAEEARENTNAFADMFSLPVIDLPTAYFAGMMMEVVKSPFLGTNGHVAIACNDVERAVAYFNQCGYRFRTEGLARDKSGILAIYFEKEIGGFAIHLRRKL